MQLHFLQTRSRPFHFHPLIIWLIGDRNTSIHNMFMVSICHIPSHWFTYLQFDLCEMYLSCYDYIIVLERYIIRNKISIYNAVTLFFYLLKKLPITNMSPSCYVNYSSSYSCTNLIFTYVHCIKQKATFSSFPVSSMTTKASLVAKIQNINLLYVQVHVLEFLMFSCILLIKQYGFLFLNETINDGPHVPSLTTSKTR